MGSNVKLSEQLQKDYKKLWKLFPSSYKNGKLRLYKIRTVVLFTIVNGDDFLTKEEKGLVSKCIL